MTKIFVPQAIPEPAADLLRTLGEVTIFPHADRVISEPELLEAVRDKNILYAMGEIPYDSKIIDVAKDLKFISAMHSSAKFVDFAAATQRNVPVAGVPHATKTTAEFTFALLMATAWRLPEADTFLRDGRWKQNQSMAFMGSRLYDKNLGILGMGQIGQMVARKAAACDMRILYHKRSRLSTAEEIALGSAEYRSIDDLFMESDFIVLSTILTNDTKGLVNERLISMMKPSAILINTSRGPVLDEVALEKALRENRIRGAALDVYQNEIPEPNPGPLEGLLDLPNVILTPHIGTAARETREEIAMYAAKNIERFLAGERPLNVFNPEVYGETAIKSEQIG